MAIKLPEVKIGLLNVFWNNGSREKPSNVIPHKLLSDFETRTNLKINWSNNHNGVVELKGHYNYLIFRNSEYFFLTPLRVKDVEKNIFVYAVERDYWMGLLSDENAYVRGSLVKTLDESTLWSFLQHTKSLVGDPNTQEVFELKDESDCETCTVIDRMEIIPFTKNQFGFQWNMTTEKLKQFISDVKEESTVNHTINIDAAPLLRVVAPFTSVLKWENYLGELLNEWVLDKNLIVGVVDSSQFNSVTPSVSKFLKHDREEGFDSIYCLTKKKIVGDIATSAKIFSTSEMRDFTLTKVDFTQITAIKCVDIGTKAEIHPYNKSIFQTFSTGEKTVKSKIYGVGLRVFAKDLPTTTLNILPLSPHKNFTQILYPNKTKLAELGFTSVVSPFYSEYLYSWLWTSSLFSKRLSSEWEKAEQLISTEAGFCLYTIANYAELTRKKWNADGESPFVYTKKEKTTKLSFVTGLTVDTSFVCNGETLAYNRIYTEVTDEDFWNKLNWSFLWNGSAVSFSNLHTNLLASFAYSDYRCSSNVEGDPTITQTITSFTPSDSLQSRHFNKVNNRRKSMIITEELGCVTDSFSLRQGDVFWSNISHGLFKKVSSSSSTLLIGDPVDHNTPHLCLFYSGPTLTHENLPTISTAGWQFGLLKAYDFQLTPSTDVKNIIQRVESDVKPLVYKITRLVPTPKTETQPHDDIAYEAALDKFIAKIKKIPASIQIDGTWRGMQDLHKDQIKYYLADNKKDYVRSKILSVTHQKRIREEFDGFNEVISAVLDKFTFGGYGIYDAEQARQEHAILVLALPESSWLDARAKARYLNINFEYTIKETQVKENYSWLILTKEPGKIVKAFYEDIAPYHESRKKALQNRTVVYRSWPTIQNALTALTTVNTRYTRDEYAHLESQLETKISSGDGCLSDVLTDMVVCSKMNANTNTSLYTRIDKEYLQQEDAQTKSPKIHCFELYKGDSIEYFMYLKWHHEWTKPVIELVVANPSLLTHHSYTNLVLKNEQDLSTNSLYTAINQKNLLWVHGQIFPIQSKLVVRVGEKAPFSFSVTKLAINNSLFSKHRVLFEGPIGEVLDVIITVPQLLHAKSYGVNEWINVERINLDMAEAQKNRGIDLLRFDENRRLANQSYQNKKEDIWHTEANYPYKMAGKVVGSLVGMATAAVWGQTHFTRKGVGKFSSSDHQPFPKTSTRIEQRASKITGIGGRGVPFAGFAGLMGTSSLMEDHMDHNEGMRQANREATQEDFSNSIDIINQRMQLTNKHKTDEQREKNQILELSYNMRSSIPNGADEIEAISAIMTGGNPVAIIHRRPSKELLEHITLFYDRYGVDIFINDFTLVFADLDKKKNHIFQFSHVDDITVHDHEIKEYLKLLLETGVRLKFHEYQAKNTNISIQRQIHIAKTKTAQASRELAKLESDTLQLKIAAQRDAMELNVADIKEELRVQAHLLVIENKKVEDAVTAKEKAEENLENVELAAHATTLAAINAALSNTDQGKIINQLNRKLATAKELTANAEAKIITVEAEKDAAIDEQTSILAKIRQFQVILDELSKKKTLIINKQKEFYDLLVNTIKTHINAAWGNYVYIKLLFEGKTITDAATPSSAGGTVVYPAWNTGNLYPNYYVEGQAWPASAGYWYWSVIDPSHNSLAGHRRQFFSSTALVTLNRVERQSKAGLVFFNDAPLYNRSTPAYLQEWFFNYVMTNKLQVIDGLPSFSEYQRIKTIMRVHANPITDGSWKGIVFSSPKYWFNIVCHPSYWNNRGLKGFHVRLLALQKTIDAETTTLNTMRYTAINTINRENLYPVGNVQQLVDSVVDDFDVSL